MRLAENEGLDNKQNVHIVSKEKEWLGQDGKEETGKGQKGRSGEDGFSVKRAGGAGGGRTFSLRFLRSFFRSLASATLGSGAWTMLMCSTLCFCTPLDFLGMMWGGLANAMGS